MFVLTRIEPARSQVATGSFSFQRRTAGHQITNLIVPQPPPCCKDVGAMATVSQERGRPSAASRVQVMASWPNRIVSELPNGDLVISHLREGLEIDALHVRGSACRLLKPGWRVDDIGSVVGVELVA